MKLPGVIQIIILGLVLVHIFVLFALGISYAMASKKPDFVKTKLKWTCVWRLDAECFSIVNGIWFRLCLFRFWWLSQPCCCKVENHTVLFGGRNDTNDNHCEPIHCSSMNISKMAASKRISHCKGESASSLWLLLIAISSSFSIVSCDCFLQREVTVRKLPHPATVNINCAYNKIQTKE